MIWWYNGYILICKTSKHCQIRIIGSCNQSFTHLCITVTSLWSRWRLKSPASRLFAQPSVQAQIKKNIKPRHWPLCGNSPVTGEFPAQRASSAENAHIWWRHHGLVNQHCMRARAKGIHRANEMPLLDKGNIMEIFSILIQNVANLTNNDIKSK